MFLPLFNDMISPVPCDTTKSMFDCTLYQLGVLFFGLGILVMLGSRYLMSDLDWQTFAGFLHVGPPIGKDN